MADHSIPSDRSEDLRSTPVPGAAAAVTATTAGAGAEGAETAAVPAAAAEAAESSGGMTSVAADGAADAGVTAAAAAAAACWWRSWGRDDAGSSTGERERQETGEAEERQEVKSKCWILGAAGESQLWLGK
ncbi:hypothetical protein CLOM_g14074 [Closterium sp. NIES-68]|nr:hypothetical protein CLOM_g14074 [Closterium sp. NIES-68]